MMQRKVMAAQVTALGEDEVEVVLTTSQIARDGHILESRGCDLNGFRSNPIILWQHNPEHPVGTAENIAVNDNAITARIRFAPAGSSPKADEARALVKSGVVRAVSVGFEAIDGTPLDPAKPRGGQRITSWELLECSFVSVPADTGAVVTARAHQENTMPKRKAAAPAVRETKPVLKRGLYDCAQLAWLLNELGYAHSVAVWEAAVEEDDSKVPAMLGEVLVSLGDALIAMTQEEVAELIAGHELDSADDEVLVVEEHAHVMAGKTAGIRAFRRGLAIAKSRSGKTISSDTAACLRSALADHEEALGHVRAASRLHRRAMKSVGDMMTAAGADPTADNPDDKTIQKSDGTSEDDGDRAAISAARRARDIDLLSLAAA